MRRFVFLLLIALMTAGVSQAMIRDRAVWAVDCTGFTSNGGGFVMDRDNTGLGREEFSIIATDGAGNVIFGPVKESFFVGGRIGINEGVGFRWTSIPRANPLSVFVISPAGNGLPEQIVYTAQGNCAVLDTFAPPTLIAPIISAPVGNPEAVSTQPGSIIVNTFRLNVRSGDGPQFTVIGQLNGGQTAAVLGVNERRTWWYVQSGDLRGWIRGDEDLVFFRGDLTNTPIIQPQGTILPPRLFLFISQPIYTLPRTDSAVICTVPGNAEYPIDRLSRDGEWFGVQATCNGQPVIGWVQAELGALRNSGDLPIPVDGG